MDASRPRRTLVGVRRVRSLGVISAARWCTPPSSPPPPRCRAAQRTVSASLLARPCRMHVYDGCGSCGTPILARARRPRLRARWRRGQARIARTRPDGDVDAIGRGPRLRRQAQRVEGVAVLRHRVDQLPRVPEALRGRNRCNLACADKHVRGARARVCARVRGRTSCRAS